MLLFVHAPGRIEDPPEIRLTRTTAINFIRLAIYYHFSTCLEKQQVNPSSIHIYTVYIFLSAHLNTKMNSKRKGRLRFFIGTFFTRSVSFLLEHLERIPYVYKIHILTTEAGRSLLGTTVFSLFCCVFGLCLFFPHYLSHSLSLPAHALCPLHPLSAPLPLLCAPFSLRFVRACVHAWLCESSEDRGEPRACLVGTHDRSHRGAPSSAETTMVILDITQLSFMTVS